MGLPSFYLLNGTETSLPILDLGKSPWPGFYLFIFLGTFFEGNRFFRDFTGKIGNFHLGFPPGGFPLLREGPPWVSGEYSVNGIWPVPGFKGANLRGFPRENLWPCYVETGGFSNRGEL